MAFFGLFDRKLSLRESAVLHGKTDRHSHILFGVDDGIRTLEESLEALARQEELGVSELWCTPHIMEDVPNGTESLKARFDELCSAYNGNIKLHLAAEYMMDTVLEQRLGQRDLLTMEDSKVLVETSTINPPYNYKGIFKNLMSAGYRPLLAHPERYRYMTDADYEELHQMGVLFQLNLPSVLGYYGKNVRQKALMLLEKGLYSCMGSDCHRVKALLLPYESRLLSKSDCKRLKGL